MLVNFFSNVGAKPVCKPSLVPKAISVQHEALLDTYWKARGVFDPAQRRKLVDTAQTLQTSSPLQQGITPLTTAEPLPGVSSTWVLEDGGSPEVLEVSRRLLQLYQLLGGSGLESSSLLGPEADRPASVSSSDVVWMVTREPSLLTSDFRRVTRRLLEMKVAVAGTGVDVPRVVAHQPALLLSDSWAQNLAALQPRSSRSTNNADPSTSSSSSSNDGIVGQKKGSEQLQSNGAHEQGGLGSQAPKEQEEGDLVTEMLVAWEYGLSIDGQQEWSHRFHQLVDYIGRFGDTAVGYRDGDDPELARWASKQRSEHRRGQLHTTRLQCLMDAGFEFNADQAEWMRWYKELEKYQVAQGSAIPVPLTMGVDLYLINWCSVQRIARRSRVLSEERIQALNRLGFDWSGADPLS